MNVQGSTYNVQSEAFRIILGTNSVKYIHDLPRLSTPPTPFQGQRPKSTKSRRLRHKTHKTIEN